MPGGISELPPAPATLASPKKLIVCCDGTWQNSISGLFSGTFFSWLYRGSRQNQTNVTRISRAIKPLSNDNRPQIIFYQPGIGSEGNIIQRLVGGAIGAGLSLDIREAYSFIANNYLAGDEIYLTGFSRGAYTARSVAGFISDLGILTRVGLDNLVNIFLDWESTGTSGYQSLLAKVDPLFQFTTPATDGKAYLAAYRAELLRCGYTRTEGVTINAIGVWDTVGALGIPVNPLLQRIGLPYHLRFYRFYDVKLSNDMLNAFQALALDEHRSAYRPTLWDKELDNTTNLKQTWFPGAHSDVGGGHDDSGLANISLAWMMSQLAPFIDFYPDYLGRELQKHKQYLERKKLPKAAHKWATGQIDDTARKIAYLFLGTRWRAPGRYHSVDRKTDIKNKDDPLKNTNEHIHVAVRSRIRTGGLNYKNDFVDYHPKALEGYVELMPEAEPGQASWKYDGKEKGFYGKVLPEDDLGIFEKEAFENYVSPR